MKTIIILIMSIFCGAVGIAEEKIYQKTEELWLRSENRWEPTLRITYHYNSNGVMEKEIKEHYYKEWLPLSTNIYYNNAIGKPDSVYGYNDYVDGKNDYRESIMSIMSIIN